MEHLTAPQREVAAGDVKAGHQQIAAGGGLGQVDDLAHIAGVDVGADEQQARLGQAAAALVHRDGGHVRARRHGRDGQAAAAEVEVGAVGLVGEAEHPGVVGHLDDGAQVGADAVVGGVVHQHGHGIRMLFDGLFHLLPLHAQRDAEALVHLGVDVDRHRAAEHQSVQHAAVDVAGQDDLIAPLADCQHHALHRAGGAAHHQEGVGRAESVGGQLLCLPDDRDRVAEIVQRFHAVDVHAHALLAQKGRQLGVAPPALVAGHVEGHHPHLPELFQRLVDGCAALVQPEPRTVLTHVFSSVPDSCYPHADKQKSASPARGVQTCALKNRLNARINSPGRTPEQYHSMIQKDGMTRVYIAITLLLLLLTVSQVCARFLRNFMVVKEPTYKI